MVANTLEARLVDGNTQLLDPILGVTLQTDTPLEKGIYVFEGGWLVIPLIGVAVFTSPIYDIGYLRRAYRDEQLPETTLNNSRENPQVLMEQSTIPLEWKAWSMLAAEDVKLSIEPGDEFKFIGYMGYNPAPDIFQVGQSYRVAGMNESSSAPCLEIVCKGANQIIGFDYFDISPEKITRTLIKPEKVPLNLILSTLYAHEHYRLAR